jgi:hypothetical protein
MNRRNYSGNFVEFVDALLKSVAIAAPRDQLERWKEELAKVEAARGPELKR